jgi:2-polyprenyl-6-methoxyphenol hydroxylase-like FAD-dependent oxidoreductase
MIVVGCDGIRSKLRQILFGEDHPASNPSYTHKYAIRGLVTMEKAKPILGSKPARMTHCGPQAHLVTFPVVQGTVLNMVAFVHDPGEWTAKDGRLTAPALRSEATRGFFNFGPVVRGLIDLLPDQLDKWAIFDMLDNPAPYYSSGRMCLAGDAAHAAAPHHGNGAGFGVEDGLALATLLDIVSKADVPTNSSVLKTALQVYNDVRYERCQWLVDSSRKIGNVYEFMDPEVGTNHEKFEHEMYTRSHKIWDYDMDRMVHDCKLLVESRIL